MSLTKAAPAAVLGLLLLAGCGSSNDAGNVDGGRDAPEGSGTPSNDAFSLPDIGYEAPPATFPHPSAPDPIAQAETDLDVAGSCLPSGWCWRSPRPHGQTLAAVSGTSHGDVWAVGPGGLIQHFDGSAWSKVGRRLRVMLGRSAAPIPR
jgi:hypothetical protein